MLETITSPAVTSSRTHSLSHRLFCSEGSDSEPISVISQVYLGHTQAYLEKTLAYIRHILGISLAYSGIYHENHREISYILDMSLPYLRQGNIRNCLIDGEQESQIKRIFRYSNSNNILLPILTLT